MTEDTDFENVRMFNLRGFGTLTLTLAGSYNIPLSITLQSLTTCQMSFESEKLFSRWTDGCTYVCTEINNALLVQLEGVHLKKLPVLHLICSRPMALYQCILTVQPTNLRH